MHAAGHEACRLAAERLAGLLTRRGAERLDPHAERAHGAEDRRPVAGRAARDLRRRLVDGLRLLRETVRRELERVRAEGVRLDRLRARSHVRLVHLGDELGLLERQLVEAHVDEHALAVQHRPHGAVEDVHAGVGDQVTEGRHGGAS